MAIAHVQTLTPATAIGNATSTTLTPSASTTAGNLLVVALAAQGNDVISSVDDSQGNTWTVGPTVANGTNEGLSIAYTLQDVAGLTGADTITVHHTTSPGRALSCDEFSGVDTTTPTTGSAGTATGTSAAPSATMAGATTDADALIFGAFGWNGTTGLTAGSGYTETNDVLVTNGGVNRKVGTEYQIVAATSAYTADASLSGSGVWAAAVMAFKAAAGGGGPTMFTQECDVSLTINDTSKPYRIRSHQSTTVGVTASRLNTTRSRLSAALAVTASLSRRTSKLITGSLSTLATVSTNLISGALHFTQECAVSIGTSVSQSLLTRKVITGSVGVSASISRRVSAIRSASLSLSASVVRLTRHKLLASLATVASVATSLRTGPVQYLQECVALVGTSAGVVKLTRVARSASASLAPSIVRRVGVAKTVSVALSASRRVRVQTLRSVSLAVTASVKRKIRKRLSTTIGTLWSVIRARITGPKNDPQVQSITVDSSLNSVNLQGSANSVAVDSSANSVRIVSSSNTFEVTDG